MSESQQESKANALQLHNYIFCSCRAKLCYSKTFYTFLCSSKYPRASARGIKKGCYLIGGKVSPKPPNKDAIHPHASARGILACFVKKSFLKYVTPQFRVGTYSKSPLPLLVRGDRGGIIYSFSKGGRGIYATMPGQ